MLTEDALLNTYVILLERVRVWHPERSFVLDGPSLAGMSKRTGIKVLTWHRFVHGAFDAMLICRAEGNPAIAKLLDELDGWTSTSLVTDELGLEPTVGNRNPLSAHLASTVDGL